MKLIKLVPDATNFHFLKWRNLAMGVSIVLIIASLALVFTRGLNFGVDFVGGQSVTVDFVQQPDRNQLQARMDALGLGEVTIQQFGNSNSVLIRTPLPQGDAGAADRAGQQLLAGIRAAYPTARPGGVDTVSGKVSGELLQTGVISLTLAMLAISIYIWFRFEWQFGVGALFSLFHDVALTFGFFALTQLEFNLSIVAAILTIIGYSLNDTIVVYDRIRENLRKFRRMGIVELLDLSVNETLSRTMMTSFTMIAALAALLILGPNIIFGFTAAMLLGIFIGTYSSVYMAAPILVWLKVGPDSFLAEEEAEKAAAKPADPNAGAVV